MFIVLGPITEKIKTQEPTTKLQFSCPMPDWHLQHNNIPEIFLVYMVLLVSQYTHVRLVTVAMNFGYLYNCLVGPFFKIRRDSMMLGKGRALFLISQQ